LLFSIFWIFQFFENLNFDFDIARRPTQSTHAQNKFCISWQPAVPEGVAPLHIATFYAADFLL
jgi:hypothetical protein